MMVNISSIYTKLVGFDVQSLTQIIEDWENDFVTQVYVVDKSQNCQQGDRLLFTSDWYGIKGVFYSTKIFKTEERQIYYYDSSGKRPQIPIFPMVKQSIFNGKKICAKIMDKELQEDGEPGYLGMTTVDQ